jgi:type II secretory pathway component PulF
MQYAYVAKSRSGETSKGVLAAESPQQAHQMLRDKGMFALSVTALGRSASGTRPGRLFRRIGPKDLMGLTSQLAIMTKAGIDVAGALGSLVRQCPNPALQSVLREVHNDVLSGKAVSAALRNHVEVFGEAYVASVAAGEASGQLPEVLDRLAKIQRTDLRLRATRRALLAYPIVLISVSVLVVLGLMFFVLPQFAGVFAQFDMKLPVLTEFLLRLSAELRSRWWLWLVLVAGAIAGVQAFRSSDSGRQWWDRTILQLALVRDVTRSLLVGRAFRLLGVMIDSGVPLVDGLRLTRASIRNSCFRALFDRLEDDVLNGRGLTDALADATFLPSGAVEMISTAERTGTLGMVTQVVGEYYEEEGETRLRELAAMVEPVIIVVMGAVVACVVLAVMLPMFDFATMTQQ